MTRNGDVSLQFTFPFFFTECRFCILIECPLNFLSIIDNFSMVNSPSAPQNITLGQPLNYLKLYWNSQHDLWFLTGPYYCTRDTAWHTDIFFFWIGLTSISLCYSDMNVFYCDWAITSLIRAFYTCKHSLLETSGKSVSPLPNFYTLIFLSHRSLQFSPVASGVWMEVFVMKTPVHVWRDIQELTADSVSNTLNL